MGTFLQDWPTHNGDKQHNKAGRTSNKHSKSNKSLGLDLIQNEFYKYILIECTHSILNRFNIIQGTEQVPQSMAKIQNTLLFKKGDPKDPLKYRGISLINNIYRLFTQIINNRLQTWLEENKILSELNGLQKWTGNYG